MSRDVGSLTNDDLDASVIQPFFALDLMFDSGTLYLWTGLGDQTFDSTVYTGTGNLLSISEVEETIEIAARGATVALTGVPSEILSLALTEPYQGREAKIMFGLFDNSTGVPSDLMEIFTGRMDTMTVEESGETCSVSLTLENKLIDLERGSPARFTSAYQKSIYPGDKGLDFVESIQDKDIVWGRK